MTDNTLSGLDRRAIVAASGAALIAPLFPRNVGVIDARSPPSRTSAAEALPQRDLADEEAPRNILRASTAVTAEQYGGVGFASASEALAGMDSTKAIQNAADAAASARVCLEGNGRWYKVGTITWPPNTIVRDLRLIAKSGSADITPFMVDGRASAVENVVFIDCEANGNRVNQTTLSTSGGDGQRYGFAIQGRCSGIKLIRPKAHYCATDGLFIYHDLTSAVVPSHATDYFVTDVEVIDPDFQWNGRQGMALECADGVVVKGGKSKNNGKDVPGFASGDPADGGYGRTTTGTLGGPKYGRAIDLESYLLGTGYRNILIEGVDCRDNYGGSILVYHRYHDDGDTIDNVRVVNCQLDDQNGGSSGDGSLVFFVVDNATGVTYAGTDKVFQSCAAIGNTYERQGLNVSHASKFVATGGRANITSSQAYSVIVSNVDAESVFSIPSNKPVVFGRTVPVDIDSASM